MKRNKLYTAGKNIYWPGGQVQIAPQMEINQSKIGARMQSLVDSLPQGGKSSKLSGSGLMTQGLGAIGSTIGNIGGQLIADGYQADGSDVVSGIVGGIQSINTGNPMIDTIKNVGAGLLGGVYNRGWGVKENKENVAAIKSNTTSALGAGRAVGSAGTNEDVLKAAGQMVGSSGFSTGDLYKNGWFTNKGTKKAKKLLNAENNALAYQAQGLGVGVGNADSNQDDAIMSNFAAFGGPLDFGGGALGYGLAMDYLTMKKREQENKDKMTGMHQVPAFMPQGGLFAFGGDMQTNSADYSVGKVYDVSNEEANRLKAMGYEFEYIN